MPEDGYIIEAVVKQSDISIVKAPAEIAVSQR